MGRNVPESVVDVPQNRPAISRGLLNFPQGQSPADHRAEPCA